MKDTTSAGISIGALFVAIAWCAIEFNNPSVMWLWFMPFIMHAATFWSNDKEKNSVNKERRMD